jgi:hypothetical protein
MTLARQEEIIVETIQIVISIDLSEKRLLTMIGNVKSVITLIFRLELNVIGVENLSQVAEEITETVDQEEIIGVAAETVGHAETTVQVEVVGHAENEDHAETTVQVEIIVEATEVAGHEESVGQVETVGEATETVDQEEKEVVAESETQTFVNSVVLEANHQGMLTTEDHNPLIPVRLDDIEMIM